MADRFADVIQQERDHLHREREELQKRLAEIDRELEAIDAYETTKSGKAKSPSRRQVRARPTRTRAQKVTRQRKAAAPRGSKRQDVLRVITENPEGLRRREILARLGVKGNKTGEMSISNALTALTKSHQLDRRDGKYVPINGG
jgi:hypothetical protein